MKSQTLPQVFGSILLAITLVPTLAWAQTPPGPGPEHERLKKMEGTWNAKVKTGNEESAAVVTYKMECGGLWLVGDFRGEFGGQRFQGRGMDGYDPEKKKYVSVWVDSMSFCPMLMEGSYDTAKKSLTMTGEAPGPDGKMAKHKMVTLMSDDDHHTFNMYIVAPDGQETKFMTIEYTRKK